MFQNHTRQDNLAVGSTCWNMAVVAGLVDSLGNWTMDPVYTYGNRTDYPAVIGFITNTGTTPVTVGVNTGILSTTVKLEP
jgi:hypothetical protein